jgi:hypothetical protein
MNQKITLSLLGLTLAVVATLAVAPIVGEMAYAFAGNHQSANGGDANGGAGGANGVNNGGGSQVTGHDRACENSGAAAHNPNCNGGIAGASASSGARGGNGAAG